MKLLRVALLAVVLCVGLAAAHETDQRRSGAHRLPLFPEADPPRFPLLHTSLSTLLPILPQLAPPPSHTLLVTLATPGFKHLLFNYICFLRYKARWGGGTEPSAEYDDDDDDDDDDDAAAGSATDFLPLLVVTSDAGLARELTEDHGIVVWHLPPGDSAPRKSTNGSSASSHSKSRDAFAALRALDLLLPPTPPSNLDQDQKMLAWGSLHYQSLMLERTLVMSILVGALSDSQRITGEQRRQAEREWAARVEAHDWESGTIIRPEPFKGVKGVLLVDNDAVWLSSPSSFLSHPYRPGGSHPSFLWAPDMSPFQANPFGSYSTPCACFIYSRVSDDGAYRASKIETIERDPGDGEYRPSEGAALAWRWTGLCHTAMVMNSLEQARYSARWWGSTDASEAEDEEEEGDEEEKEDEEDEEEEADSVPSDEGDDARDEPDDEQVGDTETEPTIGDSPSTHNGAGTRSSEPDTTSISSLIRAVAPSFQGTCLAPALHLASLPTTHLPPLTHDQWLHALASPTSLLELLESAGMGSGSTSSSIEEETIDDSLTQEQQAQAVAARDRRRRAAALARPTQRTTCDRVLSALAHTCQLRTEDESTLTRSWRRQHRPIRHEALPYDSFPPGMRFFGGGAERGQRACVVHANYATGKLKEELLRGRGLWALIPPTAHDDKWTCDAGVMRRA